MISCLKKFELKLLLEKEDESFYDKEVKLLWFLYQTT